MSFLNARAIFATCFDSLSNLSRSCHLTFLEGCSNKVFQTKVSTIFNSFTTLACSKLMIKGQWLFYDDLRKSSWKSCSNFRKVLLFKCTCDFWNFLTVRQAKHAAVIWRSLSAQKIRISYFMVLFMITDSSTKTTLFWVLLLELDFSLGQSVNFIHWGVRWTPQCIKWIFSAVLNQGTSNKGEHNFEKFVIIAFLT